MPRYFFNVSDGNWIEDKVGLELPDAQAAKAQARDLAKLFVNRDAWDLSARVIVTDEQGGSCGK